jgi:hypothetical protein
MDGAMAECNAQEWMLSWRVCGTRLNRFKSSETRTRVQESLAMPIKGMCAMIVAYAIAILMGGEGSETIFIRFASFGFFIGAILCITNIFYYYPKLTDETEIRLTNKGIFLGSRFISFDTGDSALRAVGIIRTDGGMHLQLHMQRGLWPFGDAWYLSIPVTDCLAGEMLVAIDALAEFWGLETNSDTLSAELC